MYVCFTALESVEIFVEEEAVPIQHYLRQPQRLVRAIVNPELMKQQSEDLYELKMRPINFMELYHFQPIVVLKVWAGASGTVYLNSQSCEIKGIDYINQRFSLNLKGKLFPCSENGKTYLKGRADLEVKVELPPALWLTPKPILELAGNGLLKSVLQRIKQRLVAQLLKDYRHWAQNESENCLSLPASNVLPAADNPIT
jgi:Protein of unknown function (DUF1997)